jgi:hypothetical protein
MESVVRISMTVRFLVEHYSNVLLRAKKVGHQISVSFEKFDVVQSLLLCFFPLF